MEGLKIKGGVFGAAKYWNTHTHAHAHAHTHTHTRGVGCVSGALFEEYERLSATEKQGVF